MKSVYINRAHLIVMNLIKSSKSTKEMSKIFRAWLPSSTLSSQKSMELKRNWASYKMVTKTTKIFRAWFKTSRKTINLVAYGKMLNKKRRVMIRKRPLIPMNSSERPWRRLSRN